MGLVLKAVEKDVKWLVEGSWVSDASCRLCQLQFSRNVVILKKGVPLARRPPFKLQLPGAAGVIRELREETLLR